MKQGDFMRKSIFLSGAAALAMALTGPVRAEVAGAQNGVGQVAPDAHQQLAVEVAGRILPEGAYARLMTNLVDNFDSIVDTMMQSFMKQIATADPDATDAKLAELENLSFTDLMTKSDPHFPERLSIIKKVVGEELTAVSAVVEPEFRMAMAQIFARKYDDATLEQLNRFFASPAGAAFANDFMGMMTEKEMLGAFAGMFPKLIGPIAKIGERIKAETAHLPSPPKSGGQGEEEAGTDTDAGEEADNGETGDEPWYQEENWSETQRAFVENLAEQYLTSADDTDKKYELYEQAENAAVDEARERYRAEGWTADATDESGEAEEQDADMVDDPADET